MTDVTEQDLERLELYLDRELDAADVAPLEARLADEPALRDRLDRLRGQRARRLAAMSQAFDTDAATVERLVASVRAAQAGEALARRRFAIPWLRPAMSAAACVALGLLLGITLHRQHGGGLTAMPASLSLDNNGGDTSLLPGGGIGRSVDFDQQTVVSVRDANGREQMRVRFPNFAQAKAFMDRVNQRAPDAPAIDVGSAQIIPSQY